MSKTNIEWATMVWNPTTGCNKVSQGCKHCYAEVMHNRLMKMKPDKYNQPFLNGAVPHLSSLKDPLKWKKPQRVFVNSMSDLFHENISFEFINAVFSVMSDVDQHIYIVLTKRIERVLEFYKWKQDQFGILWQAKDNVHIGVSVENQAAFDERVPLLLQVPAAVRFLSCEPLLGPVNVECYLPGISWIIAGGESGHHARPMHPDWARSLRDQCAAAGTPFFFKQWGEYHTRWQQAGNGRPVFKMFESYLQFTQKLWVHPGDKCIDAAGNLCGIGYSFKNATYPVAIMTKVGRHNSGHVLDGKVHHEFPKSVNEEEVV